MSSPAGFLDFFVLEASEYLEQLDSMLSRAGTTGPDSESLQRVARALRGSATMAKLSSFADVAGALERVGRALRDGVLHWGPALSSTVVATVDELKALVRTARQWSTAEDKRASAKAAELSQLVPEHLTRGGSPSLSSGVAFLAGEAANIAAGLELLATRPADQEGCGNVLRRVRALRGVAGIREVPELAEITEAAEQAAKPLELGEGPLSSEGIELLRAAAALLRRITTALREGSKPDAGGRERQDFERALEAIHETARARERIVPIDELFFSDGGPRVVSAAPNPPTSPRERFRLEMVSQAEHLRGLVSDARQAPDDVARERLRREIRRALRALSAAAASFGESDVAAQLLARESQLTSMDLRALDALEAVSHVLAIPGKGGDELAGRLATARPQRTPAASETTSAVPSALPPPPSRPVDAAPVPPRMPNVPPPAAPTAPMAHAAPSGTSVSGDLLAHALDGSIASLGRLESKPMSEPAPVKDQPLVPIDALVYRGRAAIQRAIDLREELRRTGGPLPPSALDEIFDLLDLALIS